MKLTGLHLLLTYQCTFECDHCFVWGSPRQSGTMTLETIEHILQQAKELGTIESIYFEGGEPFMYYPVLLKSVQNAAHLGFEVGLVTNSYWATSVEDASEWLQPFAGLIQDLSISSDLYHFSEKVSQQAKAAKEAAGSLNIPIGVISIARPETLNAESIFGQLPTGEAKVMYRGRAAATLVEQADRYPWNQFTECRHEDFREPGRVHVDPFGYLHICQGISIGNIFQSTLNEICENYNPEKHSIIGPLLEGGPAELVRRYKLPNDESYADECHLCYEARKSLRERFPQILTPDQMYGVPEE